MNDKTSDYRPAFGDRYRTFRTRGDTRSVKAVPTTVLTHGTGQPIHDEMYPQRHLNPKLLQTEVVGHYNLVRAALAGGTEAPDKALSEGIITAYTLNEHGAVISMEFVEFATGEPVTVFPVTIVRVTPGDEY